jgi:hypothetical protein
VNSPRSVAVLLALLATTAGCSRGASPKAAPPPPQAATPSAPAPPPPARAEVTYETTGEYGSAKLVVHVGDRRLDGPTDSIVEIDAQEDLNGDGTPEALVSTSGGGNCCPSAYMVVSVADGQVVVAPIAEAWGDYDIADRDGRRVVRHKSVDSTTYFAFDGREAKVVGTAGALKALAEVHGLGAHYTGPERTRGFSADVDADGKVERITCSIWPRWGSLTGCEVELEGRTHFLTPGGYGCARVGIVDARRNGYRKLVCNNDILFSFDGARWVEEKAEQ